MKESKVHKKYKSLYTSDKRYHVITGGRGSGKSHSVNEYLVRLTYQAGHGILFTRYTLTSAEISIIPEFKAAIERLGVEDHFDINKGVITNKKTKSFIIFKGIKASSGSNTANLKSLAGITTFVVEEAEDLVDEAAFDKIDDSVRTKSVPNRVILVMNPTVDTHWIYERWFKHSNKYVKIDGFDVMVSNHDRINHIHTTYLDVEEYLNDDWLEKARDIRQSNEEKYKNTYLGAWKDKAEGCVYTNWEIGEFDHSLPAGFGLDFGSRDPDALVRCAIDRRRGLLYIKQELYKNNLTTEQLVEAVMLTTRGLPIVADSAGKRSIHDLESNGVGIIPVKKFHGSILEGIRRVQDLRIIVDPESTQLITELKNYIWSKTLREVPVDDYNHLLDAVRYYVLENTYETHQIWA